MTFIGAYEIWDLFHIYVRFRAIFSFQGDMKRYSPMENDCVRVLFTNRIQRQESLLVWMVWIWGPTCTFDEGWNDGFGLWKAPFRLVSAHAGPDPFLSFRTKRGKRAAHANTDGMEGSPCPVVLNGSLLERQMPIKPVTEDIRMERTHQQGWKFWWVLLVTSSSVILS